MRRTHVSGVLGGLTVAMLALGPACSGSPTGADAPAADSAAPAGESGTPEPEPVPEPEAEPVDLSTDESVRDEYLRQVGKPLHVDDCVGQSGVEGVVLIGSFAHDRGCDVEGAFIGGTYIDAKTLEAEGLSKVGWKDMSAEERPAFALQWAERVLFHWGGDFVSESTKAFEFEDTPTFTAPAASVEGETIVVLAWVEEPPGMQDQDEFQLVELRFGPDGAVSRSAKDRFVVEGSRLR